MKIEQTKPIDVLQLEFLKPMNITLVKFSERLSMSVLEDLCQLAEGSAGMTLNLARELAKALGTSPDFWMNLQKNYDSKGGRYG